MRLHRQQGFSLIELLFVISVMALMAAWALPSYKTAAANGRIIGAGSDLVEDFQRARSVAIVNQHYVQIAANASGWNVGWVVTDMGQGGLATSGTIITQRVMTNGSTATISPVNISTKAAVTQLWFSPLGIVTTAKPGGGVAATPISVQTTICDSAVTNETGRIITLNTFGQVWSQSSTTSC